MKQPREPGQPSDSEPVLRFESEPRVSRPDVLVCGGCGGFVTGLDERISVEAAHEHEFMNPSGLRFKVRCFAAAPGVRGVGEPSSVWTWFPGFQWQAVVCRACALHLGWSYTRAERCFYGLISERLRTEPGNTT